MFSCSVSFAQVFELFHPTANRISSLIECDRKFEAFPILGGTWAVRSSLLRTSLACSLKAFADFSVSSSLDQLIRTLVLVNKESGSPSFRVEIKHDKTTTSSLK